MYLTPFLAKSSPVELQMRVWSICGFASMGPSFLHSCWLAASIVLPALLSSQCTTNVQLLTTSSSPVSTSLVTLMLISVILATTSLKISRDFVHSHLISQPLFIIPLVSLRAPALLSIYSLSLLMFLIPKPQC